MKPPPFEYVRPVDLDGVFDALAQNSGEATKILAGGQSLVPMMNLRVLAPKRLVDINRVPGLDRIVVEGDRLVIGALARHTDVMASPDVRQHAPLVAAAYRHVAHRPIRNRGTIGGNLAHADPASELPAVMLALDAEMALRSRSGERRVPAGQFFLGTFETAARADELLTSIHIPLAVGSRRWGFEEVSQRQGDFALVAVAATFAVEDGRCASPHLAYAGVADHAVRIATAEVALDGQSPEDALFEQVTAKAAEAVNPPEDIHADAAYRRDLVRALTRRALSAAARR
ncbi:MAG: xanthine dehydrogenase family protein subunit M [Alphaproteobacteria bacterium]|nr:xanthine dehydrogenase family protein subunit M [Alphaproteobacteria bacterium]